MRSTIRDRQQSRCYSWESINVAPYDRSKVSLSNVQVIVDYVWANEGLKYPPRVEPLPKQSHFAGDANRTTVRFRDTTNTWIILHELAHSMSSTTEINEFSFAEGRTNAHGALFMGIYLQLLRTYLKMDFQKLASSAEAFGLKVKLDARPTFL